MNHELVKYVIYSQKNGINTISKIFEIDFIRFESYMYVVNNMQIL